MPDAAISRLCALCVIFGVLSTNAQDVNVAGTSSTAQASAACGRALTLHQYAAEVILSVSWQQVIWSPVYVFDQALNPYL